MASSEDSKDSSNAPEHVGGRERTTGQSEPTTKESSDGDPRKINSEAKSLSDPTPQAKDEPANQRPVLGAGTSQAPKPEKPTLQKSWDAIMKTVDTLDDDLVKGYKEDIDTLLVFAGLFSAVVTAFAVESYQWLEEDPADKSVALLSQIVQNMSGQTTLPSSPSPFSPSSSVVRINTFWFLSLTLALVDALFGLLCKQWLREHQRQTNTRTPSQALALRWLRHQSFEQWHVPTILASLPILLEMALFLFFAGLLELLWNRHPVPFALAFTIIGLAALFYLTTTILPGFTIVRQALCVHPDFIMAGFLLPRRISYLPAIHLICPYKSPQSWLMFRLFSAVFHIPGCKRLLYSAMVLFNASWKKDSEHLLTFTVTKNILNISNWSSLDLNIIRRFARLPHCPDLYVLKGFRWLVQETRDIPSMKPHVNNALAEVPKHLVMPAVFEWWHTLPSFNDFVQPSDENLFGDPVSTHRSALTCQILCFRHMLVIEEDGWSVQIAEDLWQRILKQPNNSPFMRALLHPEDVLMRQTTAWRVELLKFYAQHWDELDIESQGKLVRPLAKAIIVFLDSSDHNVESTLATSTHGLEFFTSLNNKLSGTKGIADYSFYTENWVVLMSRLRHIHQLPLLHFKPIPGLFPILQQELESLLGGSTPESVLGPVLDSHEQCWEHVNIDYYKEQLVRMSIHHINNALSSSQDSQQSSLPTSAIITSRRYLDFLTFLNNKVDTEPSFLRRCEEEIFNDWVDALEHIRVLRRLPSGYFQPVSRYDKVTGKIVGVYTPRNKMGGSAGGSEVAGGRNPEDQTTRQRILVDGDGDVGGPGAENSV
ncbi:hypothetical protein E1B28_002059 [Marasmius oreades]|uniref:DUF6535 domain-containing protein n=1 Tax=Marasmius oreades TaxID=181124 RepID=A0A9P8AFU3_9AGAR|nr:uncharacterized protein E1B28_002059 [Marasmius oreades]KAG7100286.1 hypothetical protein E1B28_002059 [Marasmius oreades]